LSTGPGSLLRLERRDERRVPTSLDTEVRLCLLDGFRIVCNAGVAQLPLGAQRVVAFIALHERPLRRVYVAGSLWLDSNEERASANLRSALWRVHKVEPRLIDASRDSLRLGTRVSLDVKATEALARAVFEDNFDGAIDASSFASDLLPDWYDDWALFERERFRQLRLRALEGLCDHLRRAGRLAEALDVGLMCVAGEPLRESAHRAVMRVYLAEGNQGDAVRQYMLCEHVLRDQLGLRPSAQTQELLPRLDD
jgi:DNA-binding SARP family transcriptional activator